MPTWSYEKTPMVKGLDYVISRGVQSIEAEYQRRIDGLAKTIRDMGAALEKQDFKTATRIYHEYVSED